MVTINGNFGVNLRLILPNYSSPFFSKHHNSTTDLGHSGLIGGNRYFKKKKKGFLLSERIRTIEGLSGMGLGGEGSGIIQI